MSGDMSKVIAYLSGTGITCKVAEALDATIILNGKQTKLSLTA